jgi:hypothetical protein
MTPYTPQRTFAAASVAVLFILGMYVMKSIFHIDSYREDHHYGELDSHEWDSIKSADHSATAIDSGDIQPIEILSSQEADSLSSDSQDSIVLEKVPVKASIDQNYFQNLIQEYERNVLDKLAKNESRTDVIIRYYKHERDSGKVSVLADYGFYLHERPVTDQMGQYESNSLFYGDSVNSEDIKLIAYLLLQQGIPIKQIVPSKYHDGWKARAIEIGTDLSISDKAPLSAKDLQVFNNQYFQEAAVN